MRKNKVKKPNIKKLVKSNLEHEIGFYDGYEFASQTSSKSLKYLEGFALGAGTFQLSKLKSLKARSKNV